MPLEIIKKTVKLLRERKEYFLLGGIILLGLALRLINIGVEPYWADELLGLEIAKHYLGDPAGLWRYLQIAEVHPPLYYYLMQGWGSLFGFGEAAIRSLSLLFSLGLIILTYWAGLVFFKSKRIGLLAAFIVAILPMQIEFGQEARPYAIYCFFGILSLILLAKYFQESKTKAKILLLAGFALASIIGLYLHYSYSLILVPLAIYWLARLIIKKSGREFVWWLATMAIIFVGFSPWLPALLFKTFFINIIVTETGRSSYFVRPFGFFENAFNSLLWTDKESPHIMEIIVPIFIKIMFAGLLALMIKNNAQWLKRHKNNLLYLLVILVASILFFLCMPSSISYTALLYRHILFGSIILALLIAVIFVQMGNSRWRLICLLFFVISLITFQIKIVGDDSLYDINYRLKIVANHINENYREGEMILTNTAQIRPQLNYYLRDGVPKAIGVFPADLMIPDFMAAEDTLGMMENESQLRFSLVEWPSMDKKLNYLIKKNQAKSVWVLGDGATEQIRKWFVFNGWKIAFEPIGSLFPLTLYVR
ncbi:MAG TPA: glycosyltransferase family 39 protein [bacterium]|nr:glycosyltransferase family 39 protein [bacterium]